MIQIEFNPEDLEGEDLAWWKTWLLKAEEATIAVVARWRQGEPDAKKDAAVYRELRDWLAKKVFAGKCGYCEQVIDGLTAEHYRPVSQVSTPDQEQHTSRVLKRTNSNGESEKHPGYFWLTFHWDNIFPACPGCNNAPAKGTKFPVNATHYWPGPDPASVDLKTTSVLDQLEKPLLLHPYRDNPKDHLRFGSRGEIATRDGSLLGRMTIDVCKLNRPPLVRERQAAIDSAKNCYLLARLNAQKAGDGGSKNIVVSAKAATEELWVNKEMHFQQAVFQFLESL